MMAVAEDQLDAHGFGADNVVSIRGDARDQDHLVPLVPPGRYTLAFVEYKTAVLFGRARMIVSFRIVDEGPNFGVILQKFYNLARLTGKAGRNGGFKVGRSSDFLREYCTLFPQRRIQRLDRIAMDPFRSELFIGKVRTVEKDRIQRPLASALHYSVIAQILQVAPR